MGAVVLPPHHPQDRDTHHWAAGLHWTGTVPSLEMTWQRVYLQCKCLYCGFWSPINAALGPTAEFAADILLPGP